MGGEGIEVERGMGGEGKEKSKEVREGEGGRCIYLGDARVDSRMRSGLPG